MEVGEQKIVEKNGKTYVEDPLTDIVIGGCHDVFAAVGWGYREKYYEDCIALRFDELGLNYKKQYCTPLNFHEKKISQRRLDLLVEQRLVVEIKIGIFLSKAEFDQILEYLVINNLRLGLIIMITPKGVRVRRVVNLNNQNK